MLSEVCCSDKQIQKYCCMFYNKLEQGHEFKGQQKKAFSKLLSNLNFLKKSRKSMSACQSSALRKHFTVFNGSEPEAVGVGVIVAGSSAVTLDEWSAAEFLQTGTGRSQSLARTLSTSTGVLHKRKKPCNAN